MVMVRPVWDYRPATVRLDIQRAATLDEWIKKGRERGLGLFGPLPKSYLVSVDEALSAVGATATPVDEQWRIGGYCLWWGDISSNTENGQRYQFAPGCFDRWLKAGKPVDLLVEHVDRRIIASTQPYDGLGELRVEATRNGVWFDAAGSPDNEEFAHAYKMVGRGLWHGASVGYVAQEARQLGSGADAVLEVVRADLLEVSLTEAPAMPGTSVRILDK